MKRIISIFSALLMAVSALAGNEYHGSFVDDSSGKTSVPGSAISSIIATSRIPFYNDGTIIYAAPNGNDSNNGLTIDTPVKTFAGINGVLKAGYAIQWADGTYPPETVPLKLTNNFLRSGKAVHVSSSSLVGALVQMFSGATPSTNYIEGGTWICQNTAGNNGCFQIGPNGFKTNMDMYFLNTIVHGNIDGIYLNYLTGATNTSKGTSHVYILNSVLDSIDWDAFNISSADSNKVFVTVSGCSITTKDGGSTVSRGINGTGFTGYITGNTIQVQGFTGDEGQVNAFDFSRCNVYLAGNNVTLLGDPGVAMYYGNLSTSGPNTINFQGHPYPDSGMQFQTGDVVNFIGWQNPSFTNIYVTNVYATNVTVNNLYVTNLYLGGGQITNVIPVVATFSVINQSSATTTTTWYHIPSAGLYRISANAMATAASTAITFQVTSANIGSIFNTSVSGDLNTTAPNSSWVGVLNQNDVISYGVGYSQGSYNAYGTIELLKQ